MSSSVFPQCSHRDCQESAVSFSQNCWAHTPHKEYLAGLADSIKELSEKSIPLNFKKVAAENLDFSHLDIKNSSFSQAHFTNTHFIGTSLSNSDMIGAKFKHCDFVGANLRRANLTRAVVSACSFSHADLRGAYLTEAHFEETDFMGVLLCNAVLWNADITGAKHLKKKNFTDPKKYPGGPRVYLAESSALIAYESYRNIKHYFYRQGLHEDASWAAYKELTMERKHFWEIRSPRYLPSFLMDILSGYTEKPARVILSSMTLVFLFGLVYYLFNVPVATVGASAAERIGFWDSLYFSFITFTTVGYGDLIPRAVLAFRIFVCIEAFSGPFMAGLYIFTLTRRYAAA